MSSMNNKFHATFQERAYLKKSGHHRLDYAMRACARLYNAALQHRIDAYKHSGTTVTRYDQYKEYTQIRRDEPDIYGAMDTKVGRGVLHRIDKAMTAFFRRVQNGEKPGFPRFKSGRRWRTIEIENATSAMLKGNKIKIKGLPTIRLQPHRQLPDAKCIKAIRIVRYPTAIYVDLTFEVDKSPLAPSHESVGIDVGVEKRVALSNGKFVERRVINRTHELRLQQKMSGLRKFSGNWRKVRHSLAKEKRRNAVRNRNECHRITTNLTHNYGLVAAEKLTISNMTRSAKGTIDEPGKNVKQKSGLNREILAQTWGVIRQQLAYKAEWAGRQYVEVDPRQTSQQCSQCNAVVKKQLKDRVHQCPHCGLKMDRDTNAAVNILRRGLAAGNSPPRGTTTQKYTHSLKEHTTSDLV